MSQIRVGIVLAVLMATTQVLQAQGAVERKSTTVSADAGNCQVTIRVAPQIAAQAYATAFQSYKTAVRAAALSSASRVSAPITVESGIQALDALAQDTNIGGGAALEPFIPAWYFAKLDPEWQQFVVQRIPTLVATIKDPSALRQTSPGKYQCDPGVVSAYAVRLAGVAGIEEISETADVERQGQIMAVAKRAAPNDVNFSRQWPLDCQGQAITVGSRTFTCTPGSDIGFLEAATRGARRRVLLFVNDTGGYDKHPDSNKKRVLEEFGVNVMEEGAAVSDSLGHGTHVEGTGGMQTNNGIFGAGVAGEGVYFVRVQMFTNGKRTTDRHATMAVLWTPNILTKLRKEGDHSTLAVSNNSWLSFGGKLKELREAVLAHLNAGAPFVNAAGNYRNNNDTETVYVPASWAKLPEFRRAKAPLITTGASSYNLTDASFSARGWRSTTVFAPGVAVYSTVPPKTGPDGAISGSDSLEAYYAGTSMSSPHVANVVANVMATDPGDVVSRLWYRIAGSSRKHPRFHGLAAGGVLYMPAAQTLDDIPPELPTDVAVGKVLYHTAVMHFTVPKDFANDGTLRALGGLEFRKSDKPITDKNFLDADWLSDAPPLLKESGEKQSVVLEGLATEGTTYVAFRIYDQGGNHQFIALPAITTQPAYVIWREGEGTAEGFQSQDWELRNHGSLRNLWHFEANRTLLAYRREDVRSYDIGGESEGTILSPWFTVPEGAVFVMTSNRGTGIWITSPDPTMPPEFHGDSLDIFVYREKDSSRPIKLTKPLPGTLGFVTTEEFSLEQFEGERIRLAFHLHGTAESWRKGYHSQSGIEIRNLEVYGLQRDKEVYKVPNGGFETEGVKERPENFSLPALWTPWRWANDGKVDFGYEFSRSVSAEAPEGTAVLRMLNRSGRENAWVLTTSLSIPVTGGGHYELSQQMRIGGNPLVSIRGYDAKGNEIYRNDWSWQDKEGWWHWREYRIPFTPSRQTVFITVLYGLPGKAGESVLTGLEVDNVRIELLKKQF